MCVLVVAVYACMARPGFFTSPSLNSADAYYNLLARGFRAGQLNLKMEVPRGFARLADPYEPAAHSAYPVLDMSYYKGRLYLYYGVTPALVLFWPYAAMTGHYLSQKDAVVVFCVVGFLANAGLLYALWRRYFARVNVAVVAAGILSLGLVTGMPLLLARCDVYEVPISCGYALTMLSMAAIWKALHESRKCSEWLAAASLAYGLAVGARPLLLFGAVILLVPVVYAWREQRAVLARLLAAMVPIALIGLGLMLYNALRFDNPFEFGLRYALSADRQNTVQPVSLRYLWFHIRVYLLEPARWNDRFPFVHDIRVPPLPAGHGLVEHAFGVLTNIPLVWLALAAPLAWRGCFVQMRSALRGFLLGVAVLFGITLLTLCLFFSASIRYEAEFLPPLVLLAVIGIFSVERILSGLTVRRRAARWGWSLLLAFSVAFNLLASVERYAEAHYSLGTALEGAGRLQEAIREYEQALRLKPDHAVAHNNLGIALFEQGRQQDAVGQFEQALRLRPDFTRAHYNMGLALEKLGRKEEAIRYYEQALRISPDYVQARDALARARAVQ